MSVVRLRYKIAEAEKLYRVGKTIKKNTMKKLETPGFTQLSIEETENLGGGGIVTSLLTTVEGIVNPIGALLDSLISSLPLPALPGLPSLPTL